MTSDDDEISDAEIFRAMAEHSKQKRAGNRQDSAKLLRDAGISFESNNAGAHLIVSGNGIVVDFWPGTGLWITREKLPIRRRGVKHLINFLRARQ